MLHIEHRITLTEDILDWLAYKKKWYGDESCLVGKRSKFTEHAMVSAVVAVKEYQTLFHQTRLTWSWASHS